MKIGQAVFSQIMGNAAIVAIVADRVYPDISPEVGRVYPQIVYGGDAAENEQAYDGPVGLMTQAVRITILASGGTQAYGVASDLANRIRTLFDGQFGVWVGINVQGVFFSDENESTEADESAGQSSVIYLIEQTYSFVFNTP